MKHTRFVILFFLIVLTLLLSATVYAEPAQQDTGLITAVTETVSLRAGPGTEWTRLAVLDPGTAIALDGRDPSGSWVRGITSEGKIGWVAARYVAAPSEQTYALRSIWVDVPFTLSAPPPGSVPVPAEASPAETVNTAGGVTLTTIGQVNVRSGPGTNFDRLGMLDIGTSIQATGRNANSTWVRATVPGGLVGWLYAAYLKGPVSSLPVVEAPAAPASTGSSSSSSTVNTAPVKGFDYGGHVGDFGQAAVDYMRRAGMTWAKRQYRYSQGEDPGAVAGLINDAHGKGFRILIGLVGHSWEVNNPGYFEQFAAFAGGVAALGADAIEVWNEQNIDREWPAGSIDPARYTQMLSQAYNAIKGANSNTLVISGALAPTGFFGGCSANGCDDAPYIAGMAAAGAANYMDCLGIHYNEGIIPPTQTSGDPRSEHYTRYFWGMVNTYNAQFRGARPLCFTELGYLSPEGYGALPGGFAWAQNVSVAQQAAWLDQAISLAAGSGKVRMVIVWNIDFWQFDADPQAGYAIIRPDGTCPACAALGS